MSIDARPDATMTGRDEVPWLTVRRDDLERLDRLAVVVDSISDDPYGLAAALRKTPTFLKSIRALAV